MKTNYIDTSYFLEVEGTIMLPKSAEKENKIILASNIEYIDSLTMNASDSKELLKIMTKKVLDSSPAKNKSDEIKLLKILKNFDSYKFNIIKKSNGKDYSLDVLYKKDKDFIKFTNNAIESWINDERFLKEVIFTNYNKAVLSHKIEILKYKSEYDFLNKALISEINESYELLQKIEKLKNKDSFLEKEEEKEVLKFWKIISTDEEEKPHYAVNRKAYCNICNIVKQDKTKGFFAKKDRDRFTYVNTTHNDFTERNEKFKEEMKEKDFEKNGEQMKIHL